MPLLIQKDRLHTGDLFVAYHMFLDQQEDVPSSISAKKSTFTPTCSVLLAEYRKKVDDWGKAVVCREWADVLITTSSYGGVAQEWLGGRWQTQIKIDRIVGFVCGSLDQNDRHECISFLKKVIRRYYPVFRAAMLEMYQDLVFLEHESL